MKILVCVDGSEHSMEAAKKAANVAESMGKTEDVTVSLIYVYYMETTEAQYLVNYSVGGVMDKIEAEKKKEGAGILGEAEKIFKEKNIEVNTILAKGHPASTIIETVSKEGFDLVVIGNRGFGGLKKLLLGSVSNAVAQEVKSSVMIVK